MPCHYAIDVERQMVYSRGWGDVRDAELLDHQGRLGRDPRFHKDFSQVWDLLEVTSSKGITPKGLREGARRHLFGPLSRRAIAAADSESFKLAHLFRAYRIVAGGEEQIHVCTTLKEARAWIQLPHTNVSRAGSSDEPC